VETFRQLDGSGGLNLLSRLLPDEERPDVDASGDGCWNARCLTGTSRCSRSPGPSRLAEDQVVLVDVARDGQRDVAAGPRMIHLPVSSISIELTVSTRSVVWPRMWMRSPTASGAVRRTPAPSAKIE
jgi:hypothetical protein